MRHLFTVNKRAFLLLANISTKFYGCWHKIIPQNIELLHTKMFLPEIKWHSLNGCFVLIILCFTNATICSSYYGKWENIYNSCGVFISFVLIYEHCYLVNNCRLSGKIGSNMSTKIFLNDNSPKLEWNLIIPRTLGPWKLTSVVISGFLLYQKKRKKKDLLKELGPAKLPCYNILVQFNRVFNSRKPGWRLPSDKQIYYLNTIFT